jgi:hypothetical protein
MKRCPKCNVNYSDNAMIFCLEDGAQLVTLTDYQRETPTIAINDKINSGTNKTVDLPFPASAGNLQNQENPDLSKPKPLFLSKEKAVEKGNKVLEIAPVVISLAHNWWQWIYLNTQYYYSFSSYVLSANFLMWLLLLIAGTVIGLFALKRCQNKSFAITSLVILSVNLLLFLVPKR